MSSFRSRSSGLLLPAAAVLGVALALATPWAQAVTVYHDSALFNAAAGPLTTIDFENFSIGPLCLPTQPYVPAPCTLLDKGVTFTATVGFPGSQRPELVIERLGLSPTTLALTSPTLPDSEGDFFASFNGPAFGLMLVTSFGAGDQLNLSFENAAGEHLVYTRQATTAYTFFGVTGLTDGPWRVSIFDPGINGYSAFHIDNVQVLVPEPASALLGLLGAAILAGRLRRKVGNLQPAPG